MTMDSAAAPRSTAGSKSRSSNNGDERNGRRRRGERTLRNGNETDEDNEKYSKRRRRRRTQQRRLSQIAAIIMIFTATLAIWHLIRRSVFQQELNARWQRRFRAQALMRERQRDKQVKTTEASNDSNDQRSKNSALKDADSVKDLLNMVESSHNPHYLEQQFAANMGSVQEHEDDDTNAARRHLWKILQAWHEQREAQITQNIASGTRWTPSYQLPPLDPSQRRNKERHNKKEDPSRRYHSFFRNSRHSGHHMAWWDEWKALQTQALRSGKALGPIVDYTDAAKYVYPPLLERPPPNDEYPKLQPLGEMMQAWPQHQDNTGVVHESLLHFNFSDPTEMVWAKRFRDAQLPFKLVDVPELQRANAKWTDDYVAANFNGDEKAAVRLGGLFGGNGAAATMIPANGAAQESANHYFAFFTNQHWELAKYGLPPTVNNQWTFATWAEHARYADATQLAEDRPHFYWQAGVDREERLQDKSQWSFISHDLPSWSDPQANFISHSPEAQKGIQCRFGERGVTAATHYDAGKNMVGMITGAKRYILSPPKACGALALHAERGSPLFRHSILDFDHLRYLTDANSDMPDAERAWLERAAQSPALETVLKAGEVLYIPSFWFHYIVSLQKSAQCNVRSGVDTNGMTKFGGHDDVAECNPL